MRARVLRSLLIGVAAVLGLTPAHASAGVVLKLGDILMAEPGNASVSVVDALTGGKTVISEGGLLLPQHKAIGVALAADGDVIVVHRTAGLIRVNPVTGEQSVLSQGGLFRDPWAIAIDQVSGYIYVADSGYDNDRPEVNQAGKIIRVDPASGAQQLIASGSPCNVFPTSAACQNTTSTGSYLAHPYGIAIDYTLVPGSLVVADMSSFNGKGAIIRIQPVPGGSQTLLWGPASAIPAPQVPQLSPMGCPMGIAVEPNGNILVTTFTYPVPASPAYPAPTGTFYGCAPPGVFRLDLPAHVQSVVNTNAPDWQSGHAYSVGSVARDESSADRVHRVITAGVSQGSAPAWNATTGGTTADGSVVWQNIGRGADWLIPFGLEAEPAPTESNPSQYNIIVGDEGHSALFRMNSAGQLLGTVVTQTTYVTSVDVITFTPPGGFKREPIRSNGQPSGLLAVGTTQATISLMTDVNATCRYNTTAGVVYAAMANTFTLTGTTTHSRVITGLTNGNSYSFYVRCVDSLGNTNLTDFAINFSVASVPVAPSVAPVAAYSFDEGAGILLLDRSGHSNHGLVSGALWTAQGKSGNALLFDGVNDWVTVADSSTLDLTTGMTVEAWVYPTVAGAGSWRNVLIKERTGGEAYNLYASTDDSAPRAYAVVAAQPESSFDVRATGQLLANTWTHLAATYNGSELRLYVNGAVADTRALSGALLTSTGSLRIGGNSVWGEFFQGRIDDMRIYPQALTQGEILFDMNAPVQVPPSDTTAPFRSNGQPAGSLPWGTTQSTLSLATSEGATCRYSTVAGVAYGSMTSTFTTTGSTVHTTVVTGLTSGNRSYYVRCLDAVGNANPDDFVIAFSISSLSGGVSAFSGVESPLAENGTWDSPGSWSDLEKNNGAFTAGPNAGGRLVAPTIGADQYSEITYDQDLGASSWVGVMTRVQSSVNGSGYLAIAYAGQVMLFRTEDTGSLNFTLLAFVNANVGTAPRRLRLESQGSTHRVYFNGAQIITHNATGIVYTAGQPGIAASVFGGPQVKITTFEGGNLGAPDTTAPFRSNGQPTGSLSWGTTQATLSLATSEGATCRYSTVAGVAYGSMTSAFTTTGSTVHTTVVTGLTSGNRSYYVRCLDGAGNANPDDFTIAFSVASPSTVTSTFSGIQSPLAESGMWDSPGSWSDLQKNNGAFAGGLNALGRLVTPAIGADQYAEITYDQDPGASSWVGVMTRVQSNVNGSGYLAIAYAGEVRFYRAEDSGGLNFILLASTSAAIGSGPRLLRLESQGNTHRVYFNGVQVITHNATGITYTGGQPGAAASVFGGPQVKILSFAGGYLAN